MNEFLERRCLAAQRLGLESVPCCILDPIAQKAEIISLQPIENMQRENLNPIDPANGILSHFQARHPQDQHDVEGVLGLLIIYMRRPSDLTDAIANTVLAICNTVGKSVMTLHRTLSLLKLSVKV